FGAVKFIALTVVEHHGHVFKRGLALILNTVAVFVDPHVVTDRIGWISFIRRWVLIVDLFTGDHAVSIDDDVVAVGFTSSNLNGAFDGERSEERRVGKEWRWRWGWEAE